MFAIGKLQTQGKSFLVENHMWIETGHHGGMGKTVKERDVHDSEDDDDRLYIGEWLAALGVSQIDVVKKTGITKGYLSHLISRKKTNPGRGILLKIARAIDVDWHLLYETPPPRSAIEQNAKYGSALLDRLGRGKRT